MDDYEERRRRIDESEKIWKQFSDGHHQEVIDWFKEIIARPVKGGPCDRIRINVQCGVDFYTAKELDKGVCKNCSGWCRFVTDHPFGEHSRKWKDYGIDEMMKGLEY